MPPIVGHFIGRGADHSLHHLLMLELMCDPGNYLETTLKEMDEDWLNLTSGVQPIMRNTAI